MSAADHAKVAEWLGTTQSHGFTVEVFLDAGGIYQAEIRSMSPDEPEVIRCDDLDTLRDLAKQRIAERWGGILNFRERNI